MKVIKSLLIGFSMFSKIPMPNTEWKEENMRYVLCFVPFIGLIIGIVEIALFWAVRKFGLNILAYSTLGVLIPFIITGGIHLDGYVDTSDALASYGNKEKMLNILSDSHIGAFALIKSVAYFIFYIGAFSLIKYKWQVFTLAVGYFLVRAFAIFIIMSTDTLKKEGLLYTLKGSSSNIIVSLFTVVYILIGISTMEFFNILGGIITTLAIFLFVIYFNRFILKKFGGINGDVVGWFISMGEAIMVFAIGIGGLI